MVPRTGQSTAQLHSAAWQRLPPKDSQVQQGWGGAKPSALREHPTPNDQFPVWRTTVNRTIVNRQPPRLRRTHLLFIRHCVPAGSVFSHATVTPWQT